MNSIDYAILTIIGFSTIIGLMRGATKELLGLVSWTGAGLSVFVGLPLVRHIARQQITNPLIADVVTGIVIFVSFLILFSLFSHVLSGYVRSSALGGVDRSLGLGFGIMRALVTICALEIIFSMLVPRSQQSRMIQEARFTHLVRRGSDALHAMLPGKIKAMVQEYSIKNNSGSLAEQKASEMIYESLEGIIQQSDGSGHGSSLPNSPTAQKDPNKKIDTQAAADNLANLTPKVSNHSDEVKYNHKQRSDLDRLVETTGQDSHNREGATTGQPSSPIDQILQAGENRQ